MRLTQCLTRAAQVTPDRVAVRFRDRQRTWAELADRIARFAGALRDLGVGDGDRVACLANNSDRYLEYLFAVPWAGGVFVPVNTRLSPPEVVHWLVDSGSQILLIDDAFLPVLDQLRSSSHAIRHVISIGEQPPSGRVEEYEDLVSSSKAMAPSDRGDREIAGIFYTGGTTGKSKGVMLSHDNLLSNAFHVLPALGWDETSNYLHAAPMFHLANGCGLMATAVVGAGSTIVDRFTPEGTLGAITEHRVTDMVLVPTMINMLVNHPDVANHDLSSVRTLLYGGSPIAEAVVARLLEVIPQVRLFQAFGQTEAGPVLTLLNPERHVFSGPLAGKTRSAGQAVYGVEVAILGSDDQELPGREVGEICGRGDNVMLGYWNQPELTEQALRSGWLHTGDAGYMDDEGFVFVVDRLKDMIITGGENVYTAEVENAIFEHPAVAECAVVGIPSDRWGEAIHAVVYLKAGATVTSEELMSHCTKLIAHYKCPRSVEFFPEPLPKSGAGKILKAQLRAVHWEGRQRSIS